MGNDDPHKNENSNTGVKEDTLIFGAEFVEWKGKKDIDQGKQTPSAQLEKPIPFILWHSGYKYRFKIISFVAPGPFLVISGKYNR